MDDEIRAAVESAYQIEREYGFLCNRQSRMSATFAAVRRLAETRRRSVLEGCPHWLLDELAEWVTHFRQSRKFGFISNLGEADHSELMAAAVAVLDGVSDS
jgi:hypothetical protein